MRLANNDRRMVHIAATSTPSRGIIIQPGNSESTKMPGMVQLSRDDRNLFEEVAFGDITRPEEEQSVMQLGCINVPVVASNFLLDTDDEMESVKLRGERGVIRRFEDLPSGN
jgi:hypothetical protein